MLSISAPSKFVLTLNSVPPFFFESILAFILVILLAIPLIARVQMLFEDPMNYFSLIPSESHKYYNTHNITIHEPIIKPTPVISVNLQLDTIHPINSSSSIQGNLSNLDMKLIHPNYNVIGDLIMNTKNLELHNDNSLGEITRHDYDYYRNKFIELNLKRQYGDRVPGNVVLNSHHLNTIDAKIIAKVNGKYKNDLFDFIDYPDLDNEKIHYNPVHHFQKKITHKLPIKTDKSIETIDQNNEIDQVPEMIDFKERAQTPTSQNLRKRKFFSDTTDKLKFKNPLDKLKKLNETNSQVNTQPTDKDSKLCKIPGKATKHEQFDSQKRASTSSKVPQQKILKSEVCNSTVEKNHNTSPDRNEGLSITCPSVASSEAFSLNSCSSKQKPSRPTSSSGSGSRAFKNSKGRINTRPRSGGYFGWDIPDSISDTPDNIDSLDENYCGIIDNAIRPKSVNSIKETDNLKCEVPPIVESIMTMQCDMTSENQLLPSIPQNSSDKLHKSRLPIRQSETPRKERKCFIEIDKNIKGFPKTEDIASQVSSSNLNSKNNQLKNVNNKMKIEGTEFNRKLMKERKTISKENFKGNSSIADTSEDSMRRSEINTFNQVDQMKSLSEENEVNSNYVQERTIRMENSMESSGDGTKLTSGVDGEFNFN